MPPSPPRSTAARCLRLSDLGLGGIPASAAAKAAVYEARADLENAENVTDDEDEDEGEGEWDEDEGS